MSIPPFEEVKIVEAGVEITGPFATMILADLGASVIKIENPREGDTSRGWGKYLQKGFSTAFVSFNRNKKSITLNLRTEKGKEILRELLREADVFVENFRPSILKEFGIDYSTIKNINPKLIYIAVSGFGLTGPYSNRACYDLVIQGMSGIMSLTGEPDGPPMPIGFLLADFITSAWTSISIMAALKMREKTDRGQKIDVSMFDVATYWTGYRILEYLSSGEVPTRRGLGSDFLGEWGTFKTKDIYLNVCSGTDKHFRLLCNVLGIDELAVDPRFRTRRIRKNNIDELREILANAILKISGKKLLKRLIAAGIPCGPIYSIDELASDRHLKARKMLRKVSFPEKGTMDLLSFPVKFSEMQINIKPPPLLGEHTEEILEKMGYDKAAIGEFRERGII